MNNVRMFLFLTALIIGTLFSNMVFAHEDGSNSSDGSHRGIILGVNVGGGQSMFGFSEGSRSIFDEGKEGGMAGLRFGYCFSNSFALTLEGFGFGDDEPGDHNIEETGFGAGFLAMTWHPGGHRFFLRTGFGTGAGEYIHPQSDELITLEDQAAFLFSLGYDWRLGNSLTLGFSLDSMILDAGNTFGPGDDFLGATGLAIQFNWYL